MSDATSRISRDNQPAVLSADRLFLCTFCICCLIGGGVLFFWMRSDATADFTEFTPGMCGEPPKTDDLPAGQAAVTIGAFFSRYDSGTVARGDGSWPRFRGADADNIGKGSVPLRNRWDSMSPPVVWEVELGEGHAAPAVAHGRVYLLDYDEKDKADALRCFALADGRELWRRWYTVGIKRNHGMSRTVPAVTDSFCVTIGPKCHVMCVHPVSGNLKWGIDCVKEYGTEVPLWYTGQCPLIDDTVAVIAPGGRVLMIGVDCATGNVLWKTPNPRGWKMSHSSVMPCTLAGRRVYLYCAAGGITAVAAEGEDRGRELFFSAAFNKSVVAPSPVAFGNNRIFLTAGYGAGGMILSVTREADTFTVTVESEYGVKEGFASEQQTPILYNGFLYGIMPKDAGELRNRFVCVNPSAPGTMLWTSGREHRFGLGPYLIADGKIMVFNEDGILSVLSATSRSFTLLGSTAIMEGVDAWGPMALVNGYLLVRDTGKMRCIDIREKVL